MEIIKKVLTHSTITQDPPVLLDIGASETIHAKWKEIAEHSICIAFDADEREFGFIEKKSSGFKKLYIYNCIVSDKDEDKVDFFLTKSPYCSSTLEPDNQALNKWAFADKFLVDRKIKLNNTNLKKVLLELGLNRIDWFKTDSQGIDLRLFQSLPVEIQDKVLTAEFEPGFIDAYKGEDKIFDVLKYMSEKDFWISDFVPKGTQYLHSKYAASKFISFSHKISPGWAEITYLNSFNKISSLRDYLLGWTFALIHEQYGFCLFLTDQGKEKFNEPLFDEMKDYTLKKLKGSVYKLKFMNAVVEKFRKQIQK